MLLNTQESSLRSQLYRVPGSFHGFSAASRSISYRDWPPICGMASRSTFLGPESGVAGEEEEEEEVEEEEVEEEEEEEEKCVSEE